MPAVVSPAKIFEDVTAALGPLDKNIPRRLYEIFRNCKKIGCDQIDLADTAYCISIISRYSTVQALWFFRDLHTISGMSKDPAEFDQRFRKLNASRHLRELATASGREIVMLDAERDIIIPYIRR